MNKIIKILVAFFIIITATIAQDTDWYTENPGADTFYISNEAELKGLAELVNEKIFDFSGRVIILTDNIDLGGNYWMPIGNNRLSESQRRFRGIFDGNEYVISNLLVKNDYDIFNASVWQAGLFGYIDGGQIKNLTVNVLSIVGGEDNGGLAAVYASTMPIENCGVNIKDSINGNSSSGCGTGGLVGRTTAELTISNSYSTGKVSTKSVRASAGGLVGLASGAITINNSFATGKISASASNYPDTSFTGGLIGRGRNKVEINESFATGNVSADQYNRYTTSSPSGSFAGGLVGGVSSALIINNSFATGDVFATYDITITSNRFAHSGGLIGLAQSSSSVTNCYSSGVISIKIYGTISGSFGGIFGRWASGTNTSVYFNSEGAANSAGTGSPTGITKKTPTQLRDITTFVNWDFYEIWNIKSEINNGFPYLRQFVECKPNEHSFVWIETTPATCTEDGEETEICSKCGETTGNTKKGADKLGHDWGEWNDWDTTEVATCTELGSRTKESVCQNDNEHIDTETEDIDKTEHLFDWIETTSATCEEVGEETEICGVCLFENDAREIEKLTGEDCDITNIIVVTKSSKMLFKANVVSDKMEIMLDDAKSFVVYDNTGNIVAKGLRGNRKAPLVWNLRNLAGRFVANGTYLVIVEANDVIYSAKIGVKR